jgi:hypothetical protein
MDGHSASVLASLLAFKGAATAAELNASVSTASSVNRFE